MPIVFKFDSVKAIEAMAYIAERLGGSVEKVHVTKLLYIADRDHFVSTGVPITGDRLCAMQYGPVPSATLSAINGEAWPQPDVAFRHIHVRDNRITVHTPPGTQNLSAAELRTMDAVLAQHGRKPVWTLVKETHAFPEYMRCYVEGTSRTIPYELLLELYGGEQGFRHGRPVISEATLAKMVSPPFVPGADADL